MAEFLSSDLVRRVLGCAIDVHRALGPGLLESAYEPCFAYQLAAKRIQFAQQVKVPVVFNSVKMECGYRVDFVIEGSLVVDLKSVERILPVHQAQVLTYLKLLTIKQGLLINFNVTKLMDGVVSLLA